jgi:hypothetical protein
MSEEHAWPMWIGRMIERQKSRPKETLTVEYVHRAQTERRIAWPAQVPNIVVNSICKQCNNCWMSDLEGRVGRFWSQ